ncbi:complex I subunit 5 family protein [Mycolicibacterium thermoresistibile]
MGGAVLAVFGPRTATYVGLSGTGLTAAGSIVVAVAVALDGPLRLTLGGWTVPLGIALRADGFAAAMLVLTAVVGTVVAVFAAPGATPSRWYWPLWLILLAGLNAVQVAGDLFNTYVALELVTVGAVALIALSGRDALRPALRYLFVAVLGSFGFLVAVALLYARTGTLDIAQAGVRMPDDAPALVVLGLVAVSMAVKTALFPLHAWLPPAHAGAAAAVSPLMSALVIKASFTVLVRVWVELADTAGAQVLAVFLGALGTAAVCWGGMLALRQTRLKHVVAYSTVAQVGYFFLLFPLLTPAFAADAGTAAIDAARHAWHGALILLLAHGVAKAAMFLTAGALMAGYRTDRLYALRGSGTRFPMLAFAFAAAAVSLAGLPPTFGFIGKWETLWAALGTGQWWWIAVLLFGGLLTVAYSARVLTVMLRGDVGSESAPPIPASMRWTALVLAVLAVLLGLAALPILELLDVGSALEGPP